MSTSTVLIKVLTFLIAVCSLFYASLNSTFSNFLLIIFGFILLLEVLYYFPSKLNYPGEVNDKNKEILYSTAKQLLLWTAFLLSLMVLVQALQFWTTILQGIIVLALVAVVAKDAIIISRNVG